MAASSRGEARMRSSEAIAGQPQRSCMPSIRDRRHFGLRDPACTVDTNDDTLLAPA